MLRLQNGVTHAFVCGFAAMVCYTGVNDQYLLYYLMSPSFDQNANNTENAKGVAYPA